MITSNCFAKSDPSSSHQQYNVAQEGHDNAVRPYTSGENTSMSALNEESKEKSLVEDYENVIFKMDE